METITEEKELAPAGFSWLERDGVRALQCDALSAEGFANAFSTRAGGVSPYPRDSLNLAGFNEDAAENIHENRRRFLALLGGDWSLAACWQVHGSDVRVVSEELDARSRTGSEDQHCDALTTNLPGVLVGVKTADCVPLLLADARTGACAAVHAGWRGTLAEIVVRALERMGAEYGTRAADVRAAIGPAALACCYEVGPEVVAAFSEKFPRAAEWFAPTREGHALVDLHRANAEQLAAAGVRPEKVHALPLCTMCRTDLFFSYRREKRLHGKTGRLLSVIGRR
jgi:YfiH family protein